MHRGGMSAVPRPRSPRRSNSPRLPSEFHPGSKIQAATFTSPPYSPLFLAFLAAPARHWPRRHSERSEGSWLVLKTGAVTGNITLLLFPLNVPTFFAPALYWKTGVGCGCPTSKRC